MCAITVIHPRTRAWASHRITVEIRPRYQGWFTSRLHYNEKTASDFVYIPNGGNIQHKQNSKNKPPPWNAYDNCTRWTTLVVQCLMKNT
jgi:hypothetical protein